MVASNVGGEEGSQRREMVGDAFLQTVFATDSMNLTTNVKMPEMEVIMLGTTEREKNHWKTKKQKWEKSVQSGKTSTFAERKKIKR